jgi:hypothetical protein
VSRNARDCPHCGESFEPPTEKKVFHIILIIWAVINTLGALFGTIGGMVQEAAQPNISSNIGLFVIAIIGIWAWAGMWWAIARWYGRRSQPRR